MRFAKYEWPSELHNSTNTNPTETDDALPSSPKHASTSENDQAPHPSSTDHASLLPADEQGTNETRLQSALLNGIPNRVGGISSVAEHFPKYVERTSKPAKTEQKEEANVVVEEKQEPQKAIEEQTIKLANENAPNASGNAVKPLEKTSIFDPQPRLTDPPNQPLIVNTTISENSTDEDSATIDFHSFATSWPRHSNQSKAPITYCPPEAPKRPSSVAVAMGEAVRQVQGRSVDVRRAWKMISRQLLEVRNQLATRLSRLKFDINPNRLKFNINPNRLSFNSSINLSFRQRGVAIMFMVCVFLIIILGSSPPSEKHITRSVKKTRDQDQKVVSLPNVRVNPSLVKQDKDIRLKSSVGWVNTNHPKKHERDKQKYRDLEDIERVLYRNQRNPAVNEQGLRDARHDDRRRIRL